MNEDKKSQIDANNKKYHQLASHVGDKQYHVKVMQAEIELILDQMRQTHIENAKLQKEISE